MKPGYSLREVPSAVYVAVAAPFLAKLTLLFATLGTKDWDKLGRWFDLSYAASLTSAILLVFGMVELGKRQVHAARTLAVAGACLLFAQLGWLAVDLGVAIARPKDEIDWVYAWYGRFTLAAEATAIVLLAVAGDAWRRVPVAPIAGLALLATSYHMPVIGAAIADEFGRDSLAERNAYDLIRLAVEGVAWVYVAAALAARGQIIPSPRLAHRGLQLARGALIVRLFAAIMFALLALKLASASSGGGFKILAFGVPAIAVVTSILLALGLVQVAGSHVAGMPRTPFALGGACVLWWTFVQARQIALLAVALRDGDGIPGYLEARLATFSTVGPLVAVAGMILAAIAIHTYATRTDNTELISKATGSTGAFVALMVAAMLLQSGVITVHSRGGAIMLLLSIAAANVAALLSYAGLLGNAARAIDVPPSNLPTAVARRVG